jgi:hypothetical protein
MKKLTLLATLLVLTLGLIPQAIAQNQPPLKLVNITPDTTFHPSVNQAKVVLDVVNDSSTSFYVLAERVGANYGNTAHNSQFCWEGTCYPPAVDKNDADSILVSPGDTITSFFLYFLPNDEEGTSSVTMHFYPTANPSNYVEHTFTASFDQTATSRSASTATANAPALEVLHNLSADHVALRYSRPNASQAATLQLHDLQGRRVWQHTVTATEGTVTLPANTLGSGLYLARLQTPKGTSASRKVLLR